MKKKIAVVLTAALLAFPVTTGAVFAETTSTQETATLSTTVTTTEGTDTAVDNNLPASETTTETDADSSVNEDSSTADATQDGEETPVVDADGETVEAGTLPDSPLAWFEDLIEKIQLALTFDSVKKVELITEQASEELAEAAELAEADDETVEDVEKALTRYSEKIALAQEFLEKVEDPESEESQKLQTALANVNANNVVVLGALLEKLPPQAAQKVALNIVRAMEKAVVKAAKMQEKLGQADPDEDSDNATETDSSTDTEGTETVDSTTDSDLNENKTEMTKEELKALSKEAKKALDEFRVALGVKKTPQGNAYGYYKKDKEKVKIEQIKNAPVSQTTEPAEVVEQSEQIQPKQSQPVQKSEVKKSSSKQDDNREENGRDDDHGKKDK